MEGERNFGDRQNSGTTKRVSNISQIYFLHFFWWLSRVSIEIRMKIWKSDNSVLRNLFQSHFKGNPVVIIYVLFRVYGVKDWSWVWQWQCRQFIQKQGTIFAHIFASRRHLGTSTGTTPIFSLVACVLSAGGGKSAFILRVCWTNDRWRLVPGRRTGRGPPPSSPADIDSSLISKLNERGTHTSSLFFFLILSKVFTSTIFVICLPFWQLSFDKEKALKGMAYPLACDWWASSMKQVAVGSPWTT